jgi:hypothetical protein
MTVKLEEDEKRVRTESHIPINDAISVKGMTITGVLRLTECNITPIPTI